MNERRNADIFLRSFQLDRRRRIGFDQPDGGVARIFRSGCAIAVLDDQSLCFLDHLGRYLGRGALAQLWVELELQSGLSTVFLDELYLAWVNHDLVCEALL